MAKYITELLAAANSDPSLLKTAEYKNSYAIRTILEYAFGTNNKMVLPDGTPPFKKDTAPLGMSPANFYQVVKKFYVFKRTDVAKVRLESIFIQTLESLHPSESEVLVAIKDQKLETLYPNITADVVVECGYLKVEDVKAAQQDSKSEVELPKQLDLVIDDSVTVKDTIGDVDSEEPDQEVSAEVVEAPRRRGRQRKVTHET